MIQLKNLLIAFASISLTANADSIISQTPSRSECTMCSCFLKEYDMCHHIPTTTIKDGISHAMPVDLFDGSNIPTKLPSYAIGKLDNDTSGACRKSKYNAVNLVGFKAVTDNYGQLKAILEANKGNEIDSLVVVGPMNKMTSRQYGIVLCMVICKC